MDESLKTAESFSRKWNENKQLAFKETLREESEIFQWILRRNGFSHTGEWRNFLKSKKRILDAGCGNGRVTALLRRDAENAEIVGVDLVAADIARENLKGQDRVSIFSGDLQEDLGRLGKFDFIYCQEVLHHIENPAKAFRNLVSLLEADGELAVYVYKKKAPLREAADDWIHQKIASLSYEKAMHHCRQIALLGQALAKPAVKVSVPAVDLLEIPAGEYDIQRLFYHFFLKCFWNGSLSPEENAAVNFDWYHPAIAARYTPEEAASWFKEAGLTIVHQCTDFYGITIRGKAS